MSEQAIDYNKGLSVLIDTTVVKLGPKAFEQKILLKTEDESGGLYNIEILMMTDNILESYATLSKWSYGDFGNILQLNPAIHFGITTNEGQNVFQEIITHFKRIIQETKHIK